MIFLNSVAVRLLLPTGALAFAAFAESHGWGVLHRLALPDAVEVVLAVIALDLAIYFQHRAFHRLPILWRLHMVHHADPDFDVTTGGRFHVVEILLSMGLKAAAIFALGASPIAVVAFEILLNGTSLFNHGNVRLPPRLDRLLRRVVVTPEMHRVHHSVLRHEMNSNFGFNLPWWDFVFGTYRSQPERGHEGMAIGIAPLSATGEPTRLRWALAAPFRAHATESEP